MLTSVIEQVQVLLSAFGVLCPLLPWSSWEYNSSQLTVLKLDKIYRLNCTFVSGSVLELQQFPDRMKGCYQLIVQPRDPYIKDEIDLIFGEAAGPHAELDTSEVYGRKGTLILESLVKPYSPDFTDDEKMLQAGADLEVIINLELKGCHETRYPQLTILFVDKPRANDEDCGNSFTGTEYNSRIRSQIEI